jgi:Ca2+-binding EF-hand superfamily protein
MTFGLGLHSISDKGFVILAKIQDSYNQGKELMFFGMKCLDQDNDGTVSLDDLKTSSATAYQFIVTLDFKELKHQFFERAI